MARPQQLVTKDDLLDAAWPDTHVVDKVLNLAIFQLRQAFGDETRNSRFIETVHRRGFRWIGSQRLDDAAPIPHQDDANTFVGRDDALAELRRCYSRAASGLRQVVFVTGDPGIGKTALVDEFLRISDVRAATPITRAPGTPIPVLSARGQCIESYGVVDTYRPLLEATEGLLRHGGDAVRAVFHKHAPTWLLQMPELSSAEELEALRRTVAASTNERVQRELEGALEATSRDHMVVLVVEDLHWSDPATLGVLSAMATRRDPAHLLVIATFRPVDAIAQHHPVVRLKHELTSKRLAVELVLDGLDGEAVEAYFDRRFVGHRLPSGFASQLQAQTSGNPLFLLNAIADFEQRGWLSEQDGTWRCTVELDALRGAVADSTRALIAHRIEQLPQAIQELLEAASMGGMTFVTQTAAAAVERSEADVEAELEGLARTSIFLRSGADVRWPDGSCGRQHTFRHALYQQVLARRVTPIRRQMLHWRIAARMERAYGSRAADVAAALSLHYEHAGDGIRAVDFIEAMVQQTYDRCATHEAEALLSHAVALLKALPESDTRQKRLLKMTMALGLASNAAHGVNPQSETAFAEASELARAMPTSRAYVASLLAAAFEHMRTGELRQMRSLGEELLVLAEKDAQPHVVIIGHLATGTALIYLGEIDVGLSHLQRAVDTIDAAVPSSDGRVHPFYHVSALLNLGLALTLSGRTERGGSSIESALSHANSIEMPWYKGYAFNFASFTAHLRHDADQVRRCASELLAHCENTGLPYWLEHARVMRCWITAIETRDPADVEALRRSVEDLRSMISMLASYAYSMLAEVYVAVGDLIRASAALDEAFDTRGEQRHFDAELNRQRAVILIADQTTKRSKAACLEQAEDFLERAIDIADGQGSRLLGLRATVDLCRLRSAAGKRDEARQRLTRALAGAGVDSDGADVRIARQLLDDIAPAPRRDRRADAISRKSSRSRR